MIENILAKKLYLGIFDQIITKALAPPITLPSSITWSLLNSSSCDLEVNFKNYIPKIIKEFI